MYLLKLGLLVRVLRCLLVRGGSACYGVVSRLIAWCFRGVEHFV
jgi:hypothetical protein